MCSCRCACNVGEKTYTIHVNDGVIRLNRNGSERNQRGRGRVTLQPAAGEKSLYQLKNKADNNNRGQRGQSRGNGRNEGEREKREKPRTNDTASIRASYSSRLTSQHLFIPDKPSRSPCSCLFHSIQLCSTFNLLLLSKFRICFKAVSELT